MRANQYLGTALGGTFSNVLTGDEVEKLWNEHDEDLRDCDETGVITLWARGADFPGRFAPVSFTPLKNGTV